MITFSLQMIPFKVFRKLVLIWERISDQVLKKVITLCEKFLPRQMAMLEKFVQNKKRLVNTKSRSLSPNLALPRSNVGSQ
jgi:hypothetical protein